LSIGPRFTWHFLPKMSSEMSSVSGANSSWITLNTTMYTSHVVWDESLKTESCLWVLHLFTELIDPFASNVMKCDVTAPIFISLEFALCCPRVDCWELRAYSVGASTAIRHVTFNPWCSRQRQTPLHQILASSWLIAQEEFIAYARHESFRSYIKCYLWSSYPYILHSEQLIHFCCMNPFILNSVFMEVKLFCSETLVCEI
jgi:hypothetical protein